MKARSLIIPALLIAVSPLEAETLSATWTSVNTTDKTAAATLGPASISISSIKSPSMGTATFTDPEYSAAPLPSGTSALSNYDASSAYTATFSVPVSGLMIYAQFWRGNSTTPYVYTFNHPVAILSGFASSSAAGSTLTVPTSFQSGIIRFDEPVKTLTVFLNAGSGGQIMTMGVVPAETKLVLGTRTRPKTKKAKFVLTGSASATFGVKEVKITTGGATADAALTAGSATTWRYVVRLSKTKKHTPALIQAVSNDGSASAAQRVVITRKFRKK